jgi:serine phosphatase RsbU (regulator of sigma subunit)
MSHLDREIIDRLKLNAFLQLPILLHKQVIAIACFTMYRQDGYLSKSDITSISRFCEQIAGAVHSSSLLKQVEEEREQTENARAEIEKLNEFSKKINETTDIDEIADQIFYYMETDFNIEGTLLQIVDKTKNELCYFKTNLKPFHSKKVRDFVENLCVPLDERGGTTWKIISRKKPIYFPRFNLKILNKKDILEEFIHVANLTSALIIPLLIHDEVIGCFYFSNYSKKLILTKDQINSISRFCSQMAGAIYSSSLLKQVQEERKKSEVLLNAIMSDLAKARHIQQSLLPEEMPKREDLKLVARYIPMEQVGGDLYDFIEFPNGRLGIFIADVSGHGVPAAMISSMAKLVLAIFGGVISSPSEYLSYLNQFIEGKIADNFLTCFYCIIDPIEKTMYYSNAGHPPFLHIRDRKISQLYTKGKLVGVFEKVDIEEKKLQLRKNDRFLFYTDGITEVFNSEKVEFGDERLSEVTLKNIDLPIEQHLDKILDSVFEFGGTKELQDDVTLVGMEII